MNKVLVKLFVPAIEEQYDIWIPISKKTHKIIKLLVKVICEFSEGCYNPTNTPILYDKTTAKPYDVNMTIKENNIKNGAEIVLI